jgi:hypothetical protein
MTTKSLLLIATLSLAGIGSAASLKSYDFTLSAPAQAGSVQMAAGDYSVKVMGSIAVFTNVDTGKKFLAGVEVLDAGKKFETTTVNANSKDGAEQITSVELGGSSTLVEVDAPTR